MTDALNLKTNEELAKYLATLLDEACENMAVLDSKIALWQAGVAPKPAGVITTPSGGPNG